MKIIENVTIKNMSKKDLQQVISIQNKSFYFKNNIDQFKKILKKGNYFSYVIQLEEEIIGYCIMNYDGKENICNIISFAIAESYHRQGIGTILLQSIKDNAFILFGANKLCAIIPEHNLSAHLFAKNNNFKATKVYKNHFKFVHDDFQELDGYLFDFTKKQFKKESKQ